MSLTGMNVTRSWHGRAGAEDRNEQAGGETALLPHHAHKTPKIEAALVKYKPHIDRLWGQWADSTSTM